MRRAFDGEAWHGPSVLEILDDVDATIAAAQPVAHTHTIWEIVLHLISTQRLLLRRLGGDAAALELPLEEDWPPVSRDSEEAWSDTWRLLQDLERQLRDGVAALSDEQLEKPLIPQGSSAYVTLHGHIQHTLYHAGQMNLLKQALLRSRDTRR
jgi:uncharacterized damage-inducible protein DinB